MLAIHHRWGLRRDFDAILSIERETFGGWSIEDLLAQSRKRSCVLTVAECGDQVLGFAVYELRPGRMCVVNLAALTPAARAVLIEQMRHKARSHHRRLVWLTE